MNHKIVAIVEARMTSRRLPGKHMLTVKNIPIISYLISRLKSVQLIDEIIIATTTNTADDVLEEIADFHSVYVYRGSENDVMLRVLEAAVSREADLICEITGDCPLIDPKLVSQCIECFLVNNVDYVNYGTKYGGLPDGFGSQVFSVNALRRSEKLTNDSLDREHVTRHIQNNRDIFRLFYLAAPNCIKKPNLRVTLDYIDDYLLIKEIIEYFELHNLNTSCENIIEYLNTKAKKFL